ncbi:MAG: flavodoxin domain-containing protein [Puniceicoccales bacterium]
MSDFEPTPVDIIYGTVTGNAQTLAEDFSERCDELGVPCRLIAAEDFALDEFSANDAHKVLIFSTWGDGEPPDDAIDFCEALYDQKAPVSGVKYAIVALGDSAYTDFCGCGRRLDDALKAGGAVSIMDRVDLDVDFEADFEAWMDRYFALQRGEASLAGSE